MEFNQLHKDIDFPLLFIISLIFTLGILFMFLGIFTKDIMVIIFGGTQILTSSILYIILLIIYITLKRRKAKR